MATRWGIASAGKISSDFATALSNLPKEEHLCVAVATARSLSRAEDFAKLHNINKAYGCYKDLAEDPNIEVVYVGSLNPQHLEIAKLMLENGKHVLCEKPLTMNKKQTSQLIEVAQKRGLFLMEAIWSRFFPVYERVKNEIEADAIGQVKQVIVSFGFNLSNIDRLSLKEQGGGTILDLGVYTIQLASFIFGGEKPVSIKALGHLNDDGVDIAMSATISYKNNRLATLMTNATVEMPNEAIIVGTKGTIKIPTFWCPTKAELPSGLVFEAPLPDQRPDAPRQNYNFLNSSGLCYEAAEVRACLKAGKKESDKIPHSESLLIAEIEDELRKQIGVIYSVDS